MISAARMMHVYRIRRTGRVFLQHSTGLLMDTSHVHTAENSIHSRKYGKNARE